MPAMHNYIRVLPDAPQCSAVSYLCRMKSQTYNIAFITAQNLPPRVLPNLEDLFRIEEEVPAKKASSMKRQGSSKAGAAGTSSFVPSSEVMS
jgi:hypothetical protein